MPTNKAQLVGGSRALSKMTRTLLRKLQNNKIFLIILNKKNNFPNFFSPFPGKHTSFVTI